MNQARFTKYAKSELLGQTAYYETIEQGLGARFRAEVEAAAQRAGVSEFLCVRRFAELAVG